MNNPYGSRDDRERRALRDRRDQRHGEQYDEQFATAGGRQSYSRDNEYQFDENRGRGSRYGSELGGGRSSDDFYQSGQSDWSSRSYPRQQRSFERSGYDSDREFWEGQGSQGQSGQDRFGNQRAEYPSGRFGGSSGGLGYRAGRQQDFGQPSSSQSNYWEHSGAGEHQRGGQRYGGSSDNYWQHGGRFGAGSGYAGGGYQGGDYAGAGGYQGGDYAGRRYESGGYESGGHIGGAARNRPPKGYTRSDERLREDICEQLMHSPFIDAGEVSVQVKDGKVSLEGSVPERLMKHRIEDIAEACSGVKEVDNRIRISRDQSEHGGSWSGAGATSGPTTGGGLAHASMGKSK